MSDQEFQETRKHPYGDEHAFLKCMFCGESMHFVCEVATLTDETYVRGEKWRCPTCEANVFGTAIQRRRQNQRNLKEFRPKGWLTK